MKPVFKIKDASGIARLGELTVRDKKLKTPLIFFGYRIGDKPRVWRTVDIEALMPNAYDIYVGKRGSEKVLNQGIHSYLNFNGLIMMDSGGFYFQKKGEVDVSVQEILEIEEKSKPDIGVILDFPLNPKDPSVTSDRIKRTIENTKFMLENASIPMMATIHGYNRESLEYAISLLEDKPEMIALGSQAALLYPFRANKVKGIVDTVSFVRQMFPEAFLHVFGLGSPRLAPLMFYLGVDSVDAKTWIWKAVRHMIYHNGRIVCLKKDTWSWTPIYQGKDFNCSCPVCSEEGFSGLLGKYAWQKRAIHNAWNYQADVRRIRENIKEDTFERYLEERVKGTPFSPVYEYAQKIKSKRLKMLDEFW